MNVQFPSYCDIVKELSRCGYEICAGTIAEYVEEKMDTQVGIDFFEERLEDKWLRERKESPLTRNFLSDECVEFGENSILTSVSLEKKLLVLAELYFAYRVQQDRKMEAKIDAECFECYGRIRNVTLIQRANQTTAQRCHNYVFEKFKWFQKLPDEEVLFQRPERVVDFLKNQGGEQESAPRVGQVVVYHTDEEVKHYGKVVSLEKDHILVESKFGSFHVYRHEIALVPMVYGEKYTLVWLPS